MPNQLTKARLTSLIDNSFIDVHFNPASLVYTVENKSPQTASSPKKRQFVAQFSGKLTMDLQFDTTGTGEDVRKVTAKVAKFMEPSANATHAADEANKKNPTQPAHAVPVLLFEWGSYKFNGIMESFKETIDLFSPEGVALRALVSIGLARQDQVFDEKADFSKPAPVSTILPPGSAQNAAAKGGDPRAARQLASDNEQESTRFSNGKPLLVNAAPQLNPPVAFASASASAGAGLGASASASAGIGASAGAGIGIGGAAGIGFGGAGVGIGGGGGVSFAASASAGVSAAGGITAGGALFGSKASAGVSAGAGAFAGLQTARATISSTAQLDPLKMLPATVGADVSTGVTASFSLGGAADSTDSAGLSAEVGVNFRFSDRLTFDFE